MLGPKGKPILTQPLDVRLACKLDQEGSALRISFEVTNATSEPIHVYDERGRPKAYLYDGGGGAAHALVGIPPLPEFPVAWRWAPKTTKLGPGESLRREISFGVPLREKDSYHPEEDQGHAAVAIGRLVLRVDFIRASRIDPSVGDTEKAEVVFGDEEAATCESALPQPVELLRRRDLVHRI
jgi:hypothetical protein